VNDKNLHMYYQMNSSDADNSIMTSVTM